MHRSQSQNCATFPSHIWSILWKLMFCFSPKYPGLPVLIKYFVKKKWVCVLRKASIFCYFNLTLGHFYTFNTWSSQKKPFYKVVDMVNILPLQPIIVLGAEQFVFPCNFFFAKLQLKKFWAWAETKTGLCWTRITAKAFDDFQTILIFNTETLNKKITFYRVGYIIEVMFFCFMFPL